MAREEHDREDLLAEATALVERVSLQVAGHDEPVVVGFRRTGAASVYFGADPVYQFKSGHHLRRAYVEGRMLKAERGQLIALVRRRTSQAVELERHALSPGETVTLLHEVRRRLDELDGALDRGDFQLDGQVPKDADVVGRVRSWLAACQGPIAVAESARAT